MQRFGELRTVGWFRRAAVAAAVVAVVSVHI
jgi:hypothetical protein